MPGFWPDIPRIARHGTRIYEIDENSARLAGRRRVTVVTTLGEALRTAGVPAQMRDVYRHNLAILAKYGVRIVIGSDQFRSNSVPEAIAIHNAGLMTPAALLRALSSDAAAAIFPKRAPFGLAEGAPADFLVLEADPLVDFTAIQRISRRVKAGQALLLPAQSSNGIDAQGAQRGTQSR
jgi:imidazolonepropionase-like amidohydrolase